MSEKKILSFEEKQKENTEKMTKSFKMTTITIPKQKKNKFIISANPTGYGFLGLNKDNNTYIPQIPTSRINDTIWNLNKIIDNARIKKSMRDKTNFNLGNTKAIEILFYTGGILSFLMYLLALYDVTDFKETYIWIFLSLILLIVILACVVTFLAVTKKRVVFNIDDIITRDVKAFLEKEGSSYYQGKGFNLKLGTKFCWFEINKNR